MAKYDFDVCGKTPVLQSQISLLEVQIVQPKRKGSLIKVAASGTNFCVGTGNWCDEHQEHLPKAGDPPPELREPKLMTAIIGSML